MCCPTSYCSIAVDPTIAPVSFQVHSRPSRLRRLHLGGGNMPRCDPLAPSLVRKFTCRYACAIEQQAPTVVTQAAKLALGKLIL